MAKPFNETGFSSRHPGDQLCSNLLELTRPVIEQECGKSFRLLSCVHYMSKHQYGTNYKIKAKTENDYLHIHLFSPPSGLPQINLIERGMTAEDDLALPFSLRAFKAPPPIKED